MVLLRLWTTLEGPFGGQDQQSDIFMSRVDWKRSAIFALVLPFIIFLVSPLAFYLGNHAEYLVPLTDVFPLLLLIGAAVAGVLLVLLLAIGRWPLLHRVLSGVLVGLALSAWVQSQLFAWNFGPLDGRGVNWSEWSVHANAELAVWLLIVTAVGALSCRSSKAFFSLAQGVLLLGMLTLISSWFGSHYKPKESVAANEKNFFSFHEKNNTILIVLDTFQSDVFQEIAQRWPQEVEFLRGFIFYPNTLGGYPTTQASIPLILTGKFYKNEIPVKEWVKANNASYNIADYYTDKGYGASLVSLAMVTLDGVRAQKASMETLGDGGRVSILKLSLLVMDGGLFRVLPTHFKPGFYDEGNWFFSRLAQVDTAPPGHHGNDLRFLWAFEKNAKVDSDKIGEFRYYHYGATHWPLQINENFEYEKGMPEKRESYVRQARGSLSLLRRKLERIKQLGIYDSAQILVVGDHGTQPFLPMDLRGREDVQGDYIEGIVFASSRPLFLYKSSMSTSPLSFSDAPVSLADVVCILSEEGARFKCDEYRSLQEGEARKRKFLFYNWGEEYWDWCNDYMPPMTEYVVDGDVRDVETWHNTYIEYAEGSVRKLPKGAVYTLGNSVSFADAGNSKDYSKEGWSIPESTHRWTDGSRSRLRLDVKEVKSKPLTVRLHASAFPAKGTGPQQVEVLVNGHKIAAWKMLKLEWHEASIPADLLGEGLLDIVFFISEPTAPCDFSESTDCRKLGISAHELIIVEQEAKP